ncbi:MAG: alpha/beta hydrolase [Rhodoblastus sp.]|nr:alpha/beta hydrolase [Rhodoblastus sp.]
MSALTPWPIPPGLKTIEVDGYPMAYQEAGAGAPLLLVHGSFCDYRYWEAQVAPLARDRRVFAVSLRCYFPQIWDGKGGDFSFVRHADDIAGLVRALGLGKVDLLGHSRGGAVVLEVAKRHPEILASLILSDASCRLDLPDSEENRRADAFRAERFRKLRETVEAGDVEGGMAGFLDALMGPGAWAALPAARRQQMRDNLWTTLVDDPVPLTTDAHLRQFDFPILTLLGKKSPPMYAVFAAAMREKAGFPTPVVIAGAGHAMNMQKPAEFNAAVLDFLNGLDQARRRR